MIFLLKKRLTNHIKQKQNINYAIKNSAIAEEINTLQKQAVYQKKQN